MELNTILNNAGELISNANKLLGNIAMANNSRITIFDEPTGSGSDALRRILESGNGSQSSKNLKKILLAISIAREASHGKENTIDPEKLAQEVDFGVSQAHSSYDAQSGRKSAEQAVDELFDRLAVYTVNTCELAIDSFKGKAKTMADAVIEKGLDKLIDTVTNVLATKFPTVRAAAPYVHTVVNNAKPVIRKALHKGIDILAEEAKQVMNSTVNTAKNALATIGKKAIKVLFG